MPRLSLLPLVLPAIACVAACASEVTQGAATGADAAQFDAADGAAAIEAGAEAAVRSPDAPQPDQAPDDAAVDAAPDVTPVVIKKGPGDCPGGATCPCAVDEECDDGDPCTYGMACEQGACTAGQPENCDDANVCTADACDLAGQCTHAAQDHWCEDGDPCSIGDHCAAKACTAGAAAKCDDGNGCTADGCVAGQGCQYAATADKCADANDCVEASYCTLGQCVQGKAKPCDDGKPCTWEDCDPKKGCAFIALPGPASACAGTIGDGWCFAAKKAEGTWAQARKTCGAWGGELATVRTADDNALARKLADAACGKVPAWIGLSDRAQEGSFVWLGPHKGGYSNWNGGEPNDSGGEDVVELVPEGGWNDLPESAGRPCAVCSRPMVSACDDGEPCTTPGQCAAGQCAAPLAAPATEDCDDANPCTADGCAVGLGCGHTAVADDSPCGASGQCKAGVCLMPKPVDLALAPTSCAALGPGGANGLYWIDPDGAAGKTPAFQAYCDRAAGGWTLVLKVDGAKPDSAYGSPLWTEVTPTAGATASPDGTTARLPGYATLSLTQVRLTLVVGGTARSLVFAAKAANLRALLTGPAVKTTATVLQWQALLPKGSLQDHCLLQGFQVAAPNGVKARIGILGNNEKDCGSVDSWIGAGATANICGAKDTPGAGNLACWNPDWGDAKTAAIAWIWVR
ncbi:MAG: hypothetical protein FJ100_21555 [Deltaproteobacteria bacterium]|nr:hypothetical protein [Deltaproteobacteria bacterium]